MFVTKEFTNESKTNETTALGFDYFFFSKAINVPIQNSAKFRK